MSGPSASQVLTEAVVVLAATANPLESAVDVAVRKVEDAGRRLQQIGNELSIKVSLPLVGIGTASTIAAAKFDQSMRAIDALTSFTSQQVEGLKGTVRDMGVEFAAGANAAADALFFLAIPSLTAAQNAAILRESLRGAAVGLGEAKDIALGVVGAMNAYAKSGLTAARATEILAAGTKFGRFEAAELVPQLGRLTGFAAAMNVKFEDLIGTMAVLTLTGASTAEAATSLSAILSTLAGTSAEGEELLAGFGLSMQQLRDAAAGPEGLINVLRMLDDATGGNIEQLEAIFPNIRALRGALIALAQDSEVVDQALYGVKNSVGLMDEAMAASQGSMKSLQSSFAALQDAAISIGDAISPVVIPAISALTKLVRALASIVDSLPAGLKAIVVLFLGIALAVGPVLSMFGNLIALVPGITLLYLGFRRLRVVWGLLAAQGITLEAIIAKLNAQQVAAAASTQLLQLRALALGKVLPLLRAGLVAIVTSSFFITSSLLLAAFGVWIQVAHEVKENWSILRYEAGRLARALGLIKEQQESLNRMPSTTGLNRVLLEAAANIRDINTTEPPAWLADAREASKQLGDSLRMARDRAKLLGASFDLTGAQVQAYEEAVRALTEANVDFTASVGPQGESLRQLADVLLVLQQRMDLEGVIQDFNEGLRVARQNLQAFGGNFDFAGSQITAYEQAIAGLIAANVGMDQVLDSNGTTLRQLVTELEALRMGYTVSEGAIREWNDTMAEAQRLVESVKTPLDKLAEANDVLYTAFLNGKITWDQYNDTIEALGEATRNFTDEAGNAKPATDALKQGLVDLTTRGIDRFVDSLFDAETSFKDFVRSALIELGKLLIKIELLKILAPEGKFLGIDIPGFASGGFLKPGKVGLVGEKGPELVRAGRSGMTVAPMRAISGSAAASEVISVHVTNNVSAVDSRDVARFFEENESLVAASMLRATQRSVALRRKLAGG